MANSFVPPQGGSSAPSTQLSHPPPPRPSSGVSLPPNPALSMALSNMHSGQNSPADLQRLATQASPELIATIARMLQSGQIRVPDLQTPPSLPQEDHDMEKEDGELEESEVENIDTTLVAARTVPNGPRDPTVLQGTHARAQANEEMNAPASGTDYLNSCAGAASRHFIQVIHNDGTHFQSIAQEVGDTPALRRLYGQIDLPVPSQGAGPQDVGNSINQTAARPVLSRGVGAQDMPKIINQTAAKPVRPPEPPAQVDPGSIREEYLAKLAAAKNKKPARPVAAAPSKPVEAEKFKSQAAQSNVTLANAKAKPLKTPSMTKTELARQRLEALKAEQAAKVKKLSEARTSTSKPPQSQQIGSVSYGGLGAVPVQMSQISSQISDTSQIPPTQSSALFSPTPPSGQGGLPGLFMTPNLLAQQKAPLPTGESTNLTASRKRAVAADFDTAPTNDTGSFKRPFGQSPYNDADQRMVIELSEDDDDDDEDQDLYGTSPASQHKSFHQASALQDFSSRASLKSQGSGPGTPSAGTSNNADYETKMAEIEIFKRKIAERTAALKKEKSSANSTPGKTTPTAAPIQAMTVPPVLSSTTEKSTAMGVSLENQREILKQRLEALQRAKKSSDGGNVPMMSGALPSENSTESPSNGEGPQNMTGPEGETPADNALTSSAEEGEVTDSEMDLQQNLPSSNLITSIKPSDEESSRVDSDSEAEDMDIETSSEEDVAGDEGDEEDEDEDEDDQDDEMDISDSDESDESEDEGLTPHHETGNENQTPQQHGIDDQPYSDTSGSDESSSDSSANSDDDNDDDSRDLDVVPAEGGQANGAATGLDEAAQFDSDFENLAPELRSPVEEVPDKDQKSKSKTNFVPYESVLSKFKAYKYHPDYLDEVPGGFRSMTYNHNIDPMTPLCPYETNGGICNDKQCNAQHFSSMGLNDNELLQALGTESIPAYTVEEKQKWRDGLSEVIQELRNTDMGQDAIAIASRIAEYRRQFVGDPTKILNLD